MNESESMAFTDAVARAIRGARSSYREMTQVALAQASGVNYETLKKIEKGQQKISVAQVAQIAEALGRTPQQLVSDAWDLFNESRAAMSEGSGSNVLPFNPRTAPAEELDENTTGEARAAHGLDDEGGDQPDN